MKEIIGKITLCLGLTGAIVLAGFLFVSFGMPALVAMFGKSLPVNVSVPATPAPEAVKAPTKRVAIAAPVKVYGDGLKSTMKLPDAVVKDEAAHVIAATQVKGTDRPQTITTVIDEKTGESQTFVKQDPYPWLAIETRAEVRMAYGLKYSYVERTTKPVGRMMFNYDVLRVKALTAGVTSHIDTDGQGFVGVGVAYRW